MQQGAEGTERFCIKQLLKPVDNVSLLFVFLNNSLASNEHDSSCLHAARCAIAVCDCVLMHDVRCNVEQLQAAAKRLSLALEHHL